MDPHHYRPMPWGWGLGGLLAVAALAGCGPRATLVLHQPAAPPTQAHLELAGDTAYHARGGDRQKVVLAFRRPRVDRGPADFVLYLTAPPGTTAFRVNPADPESPRGFILQKVGLRAGRAEFVRGVVEFGRHWLLRGRRVLRLDLECDDGTRVAGRATLRERPTEVRSFEQQHAADVAMLILERAATEPTEPPEDDAAP